MNESNSTLQTEIAEFTCAFVDRVINRYQTQKEGDICFNKTIHISEGAKLVQDFRAALLADDTITPELLTLISSASSISRYAMANFNLEKLRDDILQEYIHEDDGERLDRLAEEALDEAVLIQMDFFDAVADLDQLLDPYRSSDT